MGLWLSVTGRRQTCHLEATTLSPEVASASLREGWNLVVWAGEDNIASERSPSRTSSHILTHCPWTSDGRQPLKLTRGDAYWLDVAVSREWDQLYRLPGF